MGHVASLEFLSRHLLAGRIAPSLAVPLLETADSSKANIYKILTMETRDTRHQTRFHESATRQLQSSLSPPVQAKRERHACHSYLSMQASAGVKLRRLLLVVHLRRYYYGAIGSGFRVRHKKRARARAKAKPISWGV